MKAPKQKKCRVCSGSFEPRNSLHIVCSQECAIEDMNRKRKTKEAKLAKVERKEHRERKEKLKTLADYRKEAQRAFNEFIRWRDRIAGHPCISSGRPLDWAGNAVDAGHFRSTGAAPHLRFDERNCHAQSKMDNRYLSGNATDYRIGLINRIGLEAVEALEADQEPRKYSIEDLKAIAKEYRAKTRELKRKLDESTN